MGAANIGPAETAVWNSPFSPARVDASGKTTQEGSVERSPGIAPVEPLEIDADEMRNDSAGDHVAGQRTRVAPPEREQPLHAGAPAGLLDRSGCPRNRSPKTMCSTP